MANIDGVWFHYKEALDAVETAIKRGLNSEIDLINTITRYTLMSGGKRVRPLLLIISSKMGQIADTRYDILGAVIEYIHTATLLHDDVLDHAKTRRGQLAARNLYGNQASILAGDFLYTCAMRHIVMMENTRMNNLLSSTCSRMTEGEALQLSHTSDISLSEALYLKIIEYKTASLFSASCQLGGILCQASDEEIEALGYFGRNLGIAFQIADDALDYFADHRRLGKSLGQDIQEGKMTLPLIHLFLHCQEDEKERLTGLIKGKATKKDLSYVLLLMERYGSISYAKNRAVDFIQKAKETLSLFKDSTNRQALLDLADYVISRDH